MTDVVSRRGFLKGAAIGAMAASALSPTGAIAAESTTNFEAGIEWGGLYDVVVCGFGMAGEMSAITAAESGASVLVLEKSFDGRDGGNSRFCHQQALTCSADQLDDLKRYFRGLRGAFDFPTDAVIDAYCDEIAQNIPWFEERGVTTYPYATVNNGKPSGIENPEVDGGDVQCQDCFGISPALGDGAMFKYLKQSVLDNPNIELWYSAPATDLIQDPSTGVILGVTAQVNGTSVNIRARNGVILATGGYENSREFMQDYVSIPNPYPIAATVNTADGQKMAMRVGAHIAHAFYPRDAGRQP